MIRFIEKQDKDVWDRLDKHLPISEYDEKVRCCSLIPSIAERAMESG